MDSLGCSERESIIVFKMVRDRLSELAIYIFYICAQSLDVRIAQTSRQITIYQLAAIQQLFGLALHGAGAVTKHQGAIGVFER